MQRPWRIGLITLVVLPTVCRPYDVDNTPTPPSLWEPRNGIVIVPGIAGSGLYAALDHANLSDCSTHPLTAARTRVWAALFQALPPERRQRCWASKVALDWGPPPRCSLCRVSNATDTLERCSVNALDCEPVYLEPPGITVDVGPPGTTHGMDYLDYFEGVGLYGTKYFHDLITLFLQLGYKDGATLLGYPFDWRYPIWQQDYARLKQLIETYVRNHPGKKVMIIAHSLGAAFVNTFLTRAVDAEWKNTHIEGFVSVAGAYGGSHKTVRALLSGCGEDVVVNFFGVINVSLIPTLLLRQVLRTFGSMYCLMPNEHVFGASTPIVTIRDAQTTTMWGCPLSTAFPSCLLRRLVWGDPVGTTTYTMSDWWKLLPSELQPRAQQAQQKISVGLGGSLDDPGVPVYCLWSVFDVPSTEIRYEYMTNDTDTVPTVTYAFGDNTLVAESASYCRHWTSTVFSREFKNLDHMGILFDPAFNRFVASLVTGIPIQAVGLSAIA